MNSFDKAVADELRTELSAWIEDTRQVITGEGWASANDYSAYLREVGRLAAFRDMLNLIDDIEKRVQRR